MSMIRVMVAALVFVGGLVATTQASAQGIYICGSAGMSDVVDANVIPDFITSGTVDGSDTGVKIFGGYQFNKNFGVEISYVDLGKASYSGNFFGTPVTGGSFETTGFNFSAVGIIPLNQSFELFGKIGVFAWEAKARDTTGGVPFSAKDDGGDISFGIGATFNFTKNLSMRAEWERFEAVDSIDFLSLGVVFKF